MLIDVLLFGPQAELAQTQRVSVQIDSLEVTVAAVMAELVSAVPALAVSLESSRLAVNHAYACAHETIESEDEVALIGMVSGG